jgi:hypothetical protein
VSGRDIDSYRDPLDLLHRFVPIPFTVLFEIANANVVLQTNDPNLIPSDSTPAPASSADFHKGESAGCLWKIVRDIDVSNPLAEVSIVVLGEVIVYSMGRACLIAADRERREVLAFLGASVDARVYQDSILPALHRLTQFIVRPGSAHPSSVERSAAVGDPCNA